MSAKSARENLQPFFLPQLRALQQEAADVPVNGSSLPSTLRSGQNRLRQYGPVGEVSVDTSYEVVSSLGSTNNSAESTPMIRSASSPMLSTSVQKHNQFGETLLWFLRRDIPVQKGYLSDTYATTTEKARDTPSAILSRQGTSRLGGGGGYVELRPQFCRADGLFKGASLLINKNAHKPGLKHVRIQRKKNLPATSRVGVHKTSPPEPKSEEAKRATANLQNGLFFPYLFISLN